MRCKEVKRLLSAYIDGEISPEKRGEIEEHLSYCVDCKKELVLLEKLIKEIHNIPEMVPSEDFSEKLWIKMTLEGEKNRPFSLWKRVFIILGTAVVFLGLIFILQNYINQFLNKQNNNIYVYYELHGKMINYTFTRENNLVDLVLFRE